MFIIAVSEECVLKAGEGEGKSQIQLGAMETAKKCFDACKERKENDSTINGMSIRQAICHCDKNMNSRDGDTNYKSCYLEPGKFVIVGKKVRQHQ